VYENTRELPGERDNARNNARCTQARKATHGLNGQHQDVDRTLRGRVNQNDRGQEQMEKVRPTLGSRTATEQNNIKIPHLENGRKSDKLYVSILLKKYLYFSFIGQEVNEAKGRSD